MASTEQPIIKLYDKNGQFQDFLRAPISVKLVPRWLDVGTAELVVQPSDYRVGILSQPGARVMASLRGEHVIGGPVTSWKTQGPKDEQWTFTVTDDSMVTERILCYPNPEAPTGPQAGSCVRSGAAESIIKWLATRNAPLSGIDLDVAADRAVASDPQVTISARWQPLIDVIRPTLQTQRLGVTAMWQEATNKVKLDVVKQRDYPIQLSPETLTVTQYEMTSNAPKFTRVMIGDQGGSATYTSPANTTAESLYGPSLVGMSYGEASSATEAANEAQNTLNDGSFSSGLSISLSEGGYVWYGGEGGMRVGDRVPIMINGTEITDVVREATIEWRANAGLTVSPSVGGWDNSPVFALSDAVRRLGAAMRRYTR